MHSQSKPSAELIGVSGVQPITGFQVRATFTDGTQRDIDLAPLLQGPVFEPIRNDPQVFASIHVDPDSQTLAWSNGVDLAPETLYYGDTPPPWMVAWEKKLHRHPPSVRSTAVSRPRARSRTKA
jgi:hypothetical protein